LLVSLHTQSTAVNCKNTSFCKRGNINVKKVAGLDVKGQHKILCTAQAV
jgi:hypothetical protein